MNWAIVARGQTKGRRETGGSQRRTDGDDSIIVARDGRGSGEQVETIQESIDQ